jgi:hypothetical protein
MKSWPDKIRSWFAAAAFAEAGEHATAMEIAGITPRPAKRPASVLNAFDRTFVAAAFAEEGLHKEAARFLAHGAPTRVANDMEDFLSAVGLGGVRAHYVLARF